MWTVLFYWIDHPIATGNTKSALYVCYKGGELSAIAPRCYYAVEMEYGGLFMETVTKLYKRATWRMYELYENKPSSLSALISNYTTTSPRPSEKPTPHKHRAPEKASRIAKVAPAFQNFFQLAKHRGRETHLNRATILHPTYLLATLIVRGALLFRHHAAYYHTSARGPTPADITSAINKVN